MKTAIEILKGHPILMALAPEEIEEIVKVVNENASTSFDKEKAEKLLEGFKDFWNHRPYMRNAITLLEIEAYLDSISSELPKKINVFYGEDGSLNSY
jgi:hypothetical protein